MFCSLYRSIFLKYREILDFLLTDFDVFSLLFTIVAPSCELGFRALKYLGYTAPIIILPFQVLKVRSVSTITAHLVRFAAASSGGEFRAYIHPSSIYPPASIYHQLHSGIHCL